MLTLIFGIRLPMRLLLVVRSGNFAIPCERMHCENCKPTVLSDLPDGLDVFVGEVELGWVPVVPSCAT